MTDPVRKFTEISAEERAAVIDARKASGATGVGVCLAANGSSGDARRDADGKMTPQALVADIMECARRHPVAMVHFHARTPKGDRLLDNHFTKAVLAETPRALRTQPTHTRQVPLMNTSTSNFTPRDSEAWPQSDADCFAPISRGASPDSASLTPGTFPDFSGTVYANSTEKVEGLAYRMKQHGIRPELEVFCEENLEDVIALYARGRTQQAGGHWKITSPKDVLLADPIHIQFIFGVRRGADDLPIEFTGKDGTAYKTIGELPEQYRPMTVSNVKDADVMQRELDARFEKLLTRLQEMLPDARWSAFGLGRYRDPVMRAALEWTQPSGPVVLRTGVEDGNTIYAPEGDRKNATNSDLLAHQRKVVAQLGDEWRAADIATDVLAIEGPKAIARAMGISGKELGGR